MANTFKFGITPAQQKKMMAQLKLKGKQAREKITDVVNQVAKDIHADAVDNVIKNGTTNTGVLRSKIQIEEATQDSLVPTFNVHADVDYAPFIEFGTKRRVEVPPELQSYALQFKGSKTGSAKDLYDAILLWARRKGIPNYEEAAPAIAASILKNGIHAQPFLFPAFRKHRAKIKERLAKIKLQ